MQQSVSFVWLPDAEEHQPRGWEKHQQAVAQIHTAVFLGLWPFQSDELSVINGHFSSLGAELNSFKLFSHLQCSLGSRRLFLHVRVCVCVCVCAYARVYICACYVTISATLNDSEAWRTFPKFSEIKISMPISVETVMDIYKTWINSLTNHLLVDLGSQKPSLKHEKIYPAS